MPDRAHEKNQQIELPIVESVRRRPRSSVEAGQIGEQLAAEHLSKLGYAIIARNWRGPKSRNEIDLIVRDQDCLVFVEVKSARTRKYGDPSTWIGQRKRAAIIRAAKEYLAEHPMTDLSVRFDAVLITPALHRGKRTLRHIPAAFTVDDIVPDRPPI